MYTLNPDLHCAALCLHIVRGPKYSPGANIRTTRLVGKKTKKKTSYFEALLGWSQVTDR